MLAILDVDGTLVDTNYHHAIAWYRAFRQHEVQLPLWRIHRHIGMGGDQLVEALTDADTERTLGDAIRAAETDEYGALIDEVETMPGARELLEELARRGDTIVLASSAKAEEISCYLDLLDARELAAAWTDASDVESTKPAPDLVQCALAKVDGSPAEAMLVGDSRWDVEAAKRAGVACIAVRTGGFGADELREAGAVDVFESVAEVREALDRLAPAAQGSSSR